MNLELIERRKFVDSIKDLAEEMGRKGDSYTANQLFAISDFCEQMVIRINALEIQERIDRDFMRRNIEEFDKIRVAFIDLMSFIRSQGMEEDKEIKNILYKSGIPA